MRDLKTISLINGFIHKLLMCVAETIVKCFETSYNVPGIGKVHVGGAMDINVSAVSNI